MKTNFQGLRGIIKHYVENKESINKFILEERELNVIENELSLKEKNLVQLNDARDFVVVFLANEKIEGYDAWDLMSAITCAIDGYKIRLGGNV